MNCPKCKADTGQMKNGKNRSGTQTYICRHCKKTYTPEPKRHSYDDKTREQAIKTYFMGVSGRGVGKIFSFSKGNVYNWVKKNGSSSEK